MSRVFTEAELRTAKPLWVLDVSFAGAVWRFATEAVEINADGTTLSYLGSLSGVSFTEQSTFSSSDYDLPSASVTVVFDTDIAELIQQGHDLSGATGELALWIPGSDYDDRRIVVSGRAIAASYGEIGEPVTFNLEPAWLDNSRLYPPPDALVDSATWPNAATGSNGKAYPTVIGAPATGTSTTPIYVVDITAAPPSEVGLLAGHPVQASSVKIRTSTGLSSIEPVVPALDGLGRAVATVDLSPYNPITGITFWAEWTAGGGLASPFSTELLQPAGEVIRWALEQTGLKIDRGRTIAAQGALSGYQLQGFIGETADALEWLKAEVLPLLPVSLAASADGIYPIVWDYDGPPVARLTAGTDCYRDGQVEYAENEIRNEISIRWAYDVSTTDYAKRTTITGDTSTAASDILSRSLYTITSHSRYGSRAYEIESSLVADAATANKILGWQSRAYAYEHRSISYLCDVSLGWLEAGQIVELTDAGLHISAQRVMVQAIEWGEAELAVTFLLIPDPARDTIKV
jgi:hypothetical protein